jgi:hypothetical protein
MNEWVRELWWNYTDRVQQKYSEKNLSQCHPRRQKYIVPSRNGTPIPRSSCQYSSHHKAHWNAPYFNSGGVTFESQSCQRISDVSSSFTIKANSQTVVYLQICHFCLLPNPYLHITEHISLINDKEHFHNSSLDGTPLGFQGREVYYIKYSMVFLLPHSNSRAAQTSNCPRLRLSNSFVVYDTQPSDAK